MNEPTNVAELRKGPVSATDGTNTASADIVGKNDASEDTDHRALFQPSTRYEQRHRDSQFRECVYVIVLLVLSLVALALSGLGIIDQIFVHWGVSSDVVLAARRYEYISCAGLLGGTVYGAKWLYHAIAKGMWHEDRQAWRYMSPWIAVGTTIGICTLLTAGFFRGETGQTLSASAAGMCGMGFLVGYLADSFLAKMKEVTRVIFGETESHFRRSGKESASEK